MSEVSPPVVDITGRMRLVLIEDNEHDFIAFKRAFSKSAVEVDIRRFANGETALDFLNDHLDFPQLLVVDHGLPGMNGLDFCKLLIEKHVGFPLVLLTGMGSEELAVEAIKAGVYDYLVKDPNQGYLDLLPVILPEVVVRFQDRLERKKAEEERKRLESQMQQIQKLESLGVLAGGIAHHFNNLLAIILADSEMALMDLPEDSIVRKDLEEIRDTTQRAAVISRQMLSYSGKGALGTRPLDLSELIENMAQLLEASSPSKIQLHLTLKPDLPKIDANVSQLRQIVINLATNAAEAMQDKSGEITIETGSKVCNRRYLSSCYYDERLPEGEYVYLSVHDTGVGMDSTTLGKIFDPFFTTNFTGRGLGLGVVLGIVRGHHGAIKVLSKLGKGTTFQVYFPILALSQKIDEENGYPKPIENL